MLSPFPFVMSDSVFAEVIKETGETTLLNLVNNQVAFHKILSPVLYNNLEFADDLKVLRWWPLGRKKQIVLDPARSFGKPIVAREGVPAETLAAAFRAEESIERVANWFSVDSRSVRDAIEYDEYKRQIAA